MNESVKKIIEYCLVYIFISLFVYVGKGFLENYRYRDCTDVIEETASDERYIFFETENDEVKRATARIGETIYYNKGRSKYTVQ